jgi:hypothetical protein
MPRRKLVAVDHVGGYQVVVGEQVLSETHTIRFVSHEFANLPHNRLHGDLTESFTSGNFDSTWRRFFVL